MASMDIFDLTNKAIMLLGEDCRAWRLSDIPTVSQMVVDDNPSYQHNKFERLDAVLSVKDRLYRRYNLSRFGS